MPSRRPTLVLAPIGALDPDLLPAIERTLGPLFGLPTETIALLEDVAFAYDPLRDQYHSTRILEGLAAGAPAHAVKVLGVVPVDLFIPILTYVFGEAQLGGKACIVSTHRLADGLPTGDPQGVFSRRLVKEAVHELGHTFKLRHCPERSCIMHYCRSLQDVDRKSDRLCRYCRTLLDDEMKRLASR